MMASRSSTASPTGAEWKVREVESRKDAFFLVRQWHHYFGTEYDHKRLPGPLACPLGWTDDGYRATGFVAVADGVHVGGGIVEIVDSAFADELPAGRFDVDALVADSNAVLRLGVVDPDWRRLGIGRQLFKTRLDWARSYGVGMTFGFGWERRDGHGSRPLFDGHGFVPIQTFDDYYNEHRDACPDCGSWPSNDRPCKCAMTLWGRDEPAEHGDHTQQEADR